MGGFAVKYLSTSGESGNRRSQASRKALRARQWTAKFPIMITAELAPSRARLTPAGAQPMRDGWADVHVKHLTSGASQQLKAKTSGDGLTDEYRWAQRSD